MPIVSLLDLEQSLKLNQLLLDSSLNGTANANNLASLLLKNSASSLTSSNSASILANALLQQIQLQQQNNNKLFNSAASQANNTILLNCIKSNLAANLSQNESNASNANQSTSSSKQINYSRYKTELCRQFSENGECKYGDKCQFAHGINDLKDVNRHPKYKTDYCKTFHSKGFCPYGPRCHFIHEFYEKTESTSNTSNLLTTTTNSNNTNDLLFVNNDKVIKTNQIKSSSNNKSSSDNNILSECNQIDKQIEALQALFNNTSTSSSSTNDDLINDNTININTSSSTSTTNDILSDLLISNNSNQNNLDTKNEKLLDQLEEFNHSLNSFGGATGSFSPVILSSSSSSSSASVSSATSPTLSVNNRMLVKKKIQQQLANLTGNTSSTLYDVDSDAFATQTNPNATSNDQAKLSKQLLEAALLNKSLNLASPNQCDDTDLFSFLNQVKLNSPPRSPAPIRTRSSTSSTSSSSSSMSSASNSSTMSSCDYFDRLQSPIKSQSQQQQRFFNLNDLKLYALANQTDPQIDMISIKLNQQKLNTNQVNASNKSKYLGPIGKPMVVNSDLDALNQQQQQQIIANLNSLLLSQKSMPTNSSRQINW